MTRLRSRTIDDAPAACRPPLSDLLPFSPTGRVLNMHAQTALAQRVGRPRDHAATEIDLPVGRLRDLTMELVQARIVTDGVTTLAAFYADLLGARVAANEYYVEVPAGPATVGLSRRHFTEYRESATVSRPADEIILDFRTSDVDVQYGRMAALNVGWVMPPTTQPWGTRAMVFRDPRGNLVSVCSPAEPSTDDKGPA